jgi:hypothetical protein
MTEHRTEIDSPATSMKKIDNNLSSIFGTSPMEVTVIDDKGVVPTNEADAEQVETDANFVRSNMYSIVQNGQDALQYALDLAKQSDSPRAFEVVGTLMKSIADANMQLLDVHEKKAKLKAPSKKDEPSKVVNNSIVFSGSTAELHKMISSLRKEN